MSWLSKAEFNDQRFDAWIVGTFQGFAVDHIVFSFDVKDWTKLLLVKAFCLLRSVLLWQILWSKCKKTFYILCHFPLRWYWTSALYFHFPTVRDLWWSGHALRDSNPGITPPSSQERKVLIPTWQSQWQRKVGKIWSCSMHTRNLPSFPFLPVLQLKTLSNRMRRL